MSEQLIAELLPWLLSLLTKPDALLIKCNISFRIGRQNKTTSLVYIEILGIATWVPGHEHASSCAGGDKPAQHIDDKHKCHGVEGVTLTQALGVPDRSSGLFV